MRIENIWNLQTSSYGRCLRVTLLLCVILVFAVTHLMAADKIVIPSLKIIPGTTQRLVVQLVNQEEYTAFQAEFYFPKGITPVKNDNGSYSVSLSSRKGNDHSISANVVSDGGLKLGAFSMSNSSLKGNSGDLFYIDIVSESTFEGSATIEVKDILFTRTSDRKEIAFSDAVGLVGTHVSLKGDANADGEIDIADAVCIVNHVVGKYTPSFDPEAADANGDGEVDIADAVRIVNLVVGKISTLSRPAHSTSP